MPDAITLIHGPGCAVCMTPTEMIVSGDLGRHGVAVLAARESIGFESAIESDCAPLIASVMDLLEAPTSPFAACAISRAAALPAPWSRSPRRRVSRSSLTRRQSRCGGVRAACELLGFDPIHLANEGRFVTFAAEADCEQALSILMSLDLTADAAIIGRVEAGIVGQVTLCGPIGGTRIVDMLSGEQLPRIC